MKVLLITPRVPYPPYRGDKLKIFNLARELATRNELHLACLVDDQAALSALQEVDIFQTITPFYSKKIDKVSGLLRSVTKGEPVQLGLYYSKGMIDTLPILVETITPDVIYVQHLRMTQFIARIQKPVLCDFTDCVSLYMQNAKHFSPTMMKPIFSIEKKLVERWEKQILSRFPVLVCSELDRKALLGIWPNAKVGILPNAVDTRHFQPGEESEVRSLSFLFVGNLTYYPNILGILDFVHNVWPSLLKVLPTVTLRIVGNRPPQVIRALSSPSIEVIATVPDLRPYYRQAHFVVSPVKIGAGTQNKILEPLAMGKWILTNRRGVEGLPDLPSNLLLYETPEDLLRLVLLHQEDLATHPLPDWLPSWDTVGHLLEESLNQLRDHDV